MCDTWTVKVPLYDDAGLPFDITGLLVDTADGPVLVVRRPGLTGAPGPADATTLRKLTEIQSIGKLVLKGKLKQDVDGVLATSNDLIAKFSGSWTYEASLDHWDSVALALRSKSMMPPGMLAPPRWLIDRFFPCQAASFEVLQDNPDTCTGLVSTTLGSKYILRLARGRDNVERALATEALMSLARTKVPVPRTIDSFCWEEDGKPLCATVVEYVYGSTLEDEWEELTRDEKLSYVDQIVELLAGLHTLKSDRLAPNDPRTTSALGFREGDPRCFPDTRTWLKALVESYWGSEAPPAGIREQLEALGAPEHPYVLCHNDMEPRNIMVRGGKVVSIIDWEFAGYQPFIYEWVVPSTGLGTSCINYEWHVMFRQAAAKLLPREDPVMERLILDIFNGLWNTVWKRRKVAGFRLAFMAKHGVVEGDLWRPPTAAGSITEMGATQTQPAEGTPRPYTVGSTTELKKPRSSSSASLALYPITPVAQWSATMNASEGNAEYPLPTKIPNVDKLPPFGTTDEERAIRIAELDRRDAYDPIASGAIREIYKCSERKVISIDGRFVLKTASTVNPAEQGSIDIVRARTTVPVPETIERWYNPEARKHFVLDRQIKGTTMLEAMKTMSDAEVEAVMEQLRGYLASIRSITSGSLHVAGSTLLLDYHLSHDYLVFTGDDQCHAFINQLMLSGKVDLRSRKAAVVRALHDKHLERYPEDRTTFVMTHGDLGPYNVMVDGGAVACVIDWETSGFMPAYWERIKSMTSGDQSRVWKVSLSKGLPPCPEMEAATKLMREHIPLGVLSDEGQQCYISAALLVYGEETNPVGDAPNVHCNEA